MIRLALGLLLTATAAGSSYVSEIEAWRQKREARLKAEGGWLSVEGLFWLAEGDTPFGSDKANAIVLPAHAPAQAGVFTVANGETRFRLAPGVTGLLGGQRVDEGLLRPDSSDALALGPVTLHAISRGGKPAIRMKDGESARRREFKGLRWYPVRREYRVDARWVAYASPRSLKIASVIGHVDAMPSPGYAEFSIRGRKVRLEPVLEEADATELFFIFRDETATKETYGAGRFLYADMPKDGRVVLDFNKAYSPPCAFTPYATCPLPPKQNRVPVRIEAGELDPRVLH
ncbi:MAG TPA: DUF1684 domain-containing protein [Vicinamibacteria bacterium]|nr:DUF1684 domain-containing protein [Vicinamibacteria bacterium]